MRTQLQQVLLVRTAHETAHAVRRALANCIAAAAEQSVPSGQWPSLLGFLHQCSQADSAEHKEVALLLFAALFETVGGCQGSKNVQPVQCAVRSQTNSGIEAHCPRLVCQTVGKTAQHVC